MICSVVLNSIKRGNPLNTVRFREKGRLLAEDIPVLEPDLDEVMTFHLGNR